MKTHRLIKYAAIALACWALTQSAAMAQTVITTSYTNTFDSDGNTTFFSGSGSVASWIYWYGLGFNNTAMTNDPTMDAEGQTNTSGSLNFLLDFGSTGDQGVVFGTFDNAYGYDGSQVMPLNIVTQLSFDIHVQPGTVPDSAGDFGTITMALIDPGWAGADYGFFTGLTIPGAATNGWVHMVNTNAVADIVKMMSGGATQAAGIGFDYNSYGGYPKNPITFWIDNATVTTGSAPTPPPPPPTMNVFPTLPGLTLFTGSGPSLYNRESLQAIGANYSWVGATGPVSYSFTITNYPVAPNDQVQTHIFLIPNPAAGSAPDYTEPNLIFLDMESTTTGAQWNFRYKTNEANGNAFVYGAGTLASIGTNTALGTWTVTFTDNTNVMMTIPGGASTNFSIPDSTGDTIALFTNGVDLYFGVQSGNAGGTGDHVIASDFSVTGLGSSDFNDNFIADNGNLNGVWAVNAAFPACVNLLGAGTSYWVQWTSPAIGYELITTPDLLTAWSPLTNATPFLAGTSYTQLIPTNAVQPGNAAFFAVVQQNLNQLQVLLQGETAAPGTATGKTGTPTPVSISGASAGIVNVTVNAVDDKWNLIPGISDTVSITTSDSAASISPSDTGPLVAGTEEFTIQFATAANQTVTATDTSNSALPVATSAAVTVSP